MTGIMILYLAMTPSPRSMHALPWIDASPAWVQAGGRKPSLDGANLRTLDQESWEVQGDGGGILKNDDRMIEWGSPL